MYVCIYVYIYVFFLGFKERFFSYAAFIEKLQPTRGDQNSIPRYQLQYV